eukprot:GSA120T00003459001.1
MQSTKRVVGTLSEFTVGTEASGPVLSGEQSSFASQQILRNSCKFWAFCTREHTDAARLGKVDDSPYLQCFLAMSMTAGLASVLCAGSSVDIADHVPNVSTDDFEVKRVVSNVSKLQSDIKNADQCISNCQQQIEDAARLEKARNNDMFQYQEGGLHRL